MNNFFNARGGGAAGGGPIQWFHSLPPVTRLWLGSTLTVTALANFDVLQWTDLDLTHLTDVLGKASNNTSSSSVLLFGRLEIWRLLTCFLYIGKFGWHSIINLHLMTQISSRYESMGQFAQEESLLHRIKIIHNYCNNNNATIKTTTIHTIQKGKHPTTYHYPQHNVNLFGVVMKAAYLPFAYLVMGYALSNGEVVPMDMIHGMFVGHLYYYLACVVPTVLGRGRVVIWTPGVLIDLCHWLEGRRVGGVNDDDVDGGEPIVVDTDGVIGG
ncbi:Der1-like family protein [Skeletonema marinoi]|uniref:Derlin n=1 Tax=Skeletonema marinoi TaxID=267567 RepID=A0AAD8XSL5_9STRA|nr:Der1-like family protein [Skeletonema marinoi]